MDAKPQSDPPSLSRRDFGRLVAGGVVALGGVGGPFRPAGGGQPGVRIDGARVNRILLDLQDHGGTGDGGTTRVAFSDEDLAARDYVRTRLEEAGLQVSVDLAGNLIGRRRGASGGAPIMIGSHIDTVPEGGSYDGQVGSAGAIEVALTLAEHDITLEHDLEVVMFQNEEGGKTGSRALVGRVEPFELEIVTASGLTIGEGIRKLGGDPGRLAQARRPEGSLHGFFELHVEQGAVLDRETVQIGVVEGIVGIRRWELTVEGEANHAGTTPMDQRRDALAAASELTLAVERVAAAGPGRQVATVGRIEAVPGAPNVIPGLVRATLEIRDLSMARIDEIFAEIARAADDIDRNRGVATGFSRFYESLGAPTDPRLRDMVEESAHALGYSTRRMPSGAGHDAQSMAEIGPVGMIFVPSRDGISHAPEEWTAPDDVTRGANVLLHAVLALDLAEV